MRKFISAILLASALCSCTQKTAKDAYVRTVILTTPSQMGENTVRKYSATVSEADEISLGFKTAGQIRQICAKEGDYVRKGQLLATLDDVDYQLGVDAIRIQFEQVKSETARIEKLYAQKGISKNDYEKAIAGMGQLEVQLKANQNKLDYTRLYAPTDAFVQKVSFSPAEMVDAGTPLFTLLNVSHLEVEASLSVSDYLQRDRFRSFSCVANGCYAPLKLLSISPKADGTQLYKMKLLFEAKPGTEITSGMNVELSVEVSNEVQGLLLPLSSVANDGKTPYVYVYDSASSTVRRRDVELGQSILKAKAVVLSGLEPGEKVVFAGVSMLLDGEKVKVAETDSETNIGGLL